MTAIDHNFPCLSPDSAPPQTIPNRLLLAELERELHQRRDSYPGRVDKGRMHRLDAERGIDLMRALVEDYKRSVALDLWYENKESPQGDALWLALVKQQAAADAALQPFRWSEIVAELQREIRKRRKYYPQWVAAGTLEPMRARHQMERIETVHFHWWRGMAHFMPDDLHHVQHKVRQPGPERNAYYTACRAHRARFDPDSDRGDYAAAEEQQELAL
jgi:hypothetical protein